MWPLELGLGTYNPRFVAWPLELGLGTHNPRFIAWPLELGLGTHNPRFIAWPLELGLGTGNPRFVAWPELETCHVVHAEPYEGVEQSGTRPTVPQRCCKFCDEAIPLNEMLDHVAGHMEKNDALVDPKWVGDADACAFCGATNGSCCTIVVKGKVVSDCTYKWHIKYKKALRAQRNVPRLCPVELCTATPCVLDVRKHLLFKHEATGLADVDLFDWVVNAPKKGRKGKHKRTFTRAIAPRVAIVLPDAKADPTATTTTIASGTEGGGDMYRGRARQQSDADPDWKVGEKATSESSSSESGSSSSSSTSSSSSSSSPSSANSSNGSSDNTVVVSSKGRKKKFTKAPARKAGKRKSEAA